MKNKDFHQTITVNASAHETYNKIARVGDWWARSFTGKALMVDDSFRIEFGDTWVNFKITEAVPGNKIVWHVTGSYLPWLKNKTEWTDTEVVFEILSEKNATKINFTHAGLVPEIECYKDCEKGWTRFITISLQKFIDAGKGLPE